MAGQLHLLSGGAAQGLVAQLQDRFAAESDLRIHATFGAVGVMRDKLLAGEPCDVVILTQALIEQLRSEREQHARDAEAALAETSDEDVRDEIFPGIRDPFKNTPVE